MTLSSSYLALTLLAAVGTALGETTPSTLSAVVYTTAKDTDLRLARTEGLKFSPKPQPEEWEKTVFVDPAQRYQQFVGIGGALTDASAETFFKLPKARQDEIIKAYFDPKQGIGYSLGRTHIHSCDFSSGSYTYVSNDDPTLASFDVSHDLKYRIPFIRLAMAAAGSDFSLYASPWSPPAWMKSNNNMLQGGKLKPECREAWASYFVKFIHAYEKQGIPIWGITVQNEPMAKQRWESCIYSAEEERDFVRDYLGPAMTKAGLADKKIIIWDHNRDLAFHRINTILSDPEAAKYVWGAGFHWYEGGLYNNIKLVNETYPTLNLMFTEGCVEGPVNSTNFGAWTYGERYGTSMINDFNCGAVAWTDWNVLLDEHGGPNHVGNFCYAPVIGDTQNGEAHYLNSYYYLGHFSKFIRPGARRIASSSMSANLLTTAFRNKDGTVAVVVMNGSDNQQQFYLWLDGKAARTESRPHSIMTFVISGAASQDLAANGSPSSERQPAQN